MRKLTLSILASAAVAFATPALAAPMIFTSPGPVQPTSNVLFQSGATTGNPVTGSLNDSSALVNFTSNESLNVTQSNGQARISGTDGDLTNLVISLTSGFTFSAIEFNLNALANGSATLTFAGADGISSVFPISLNGQNFFSATGNFTSVTINSTVQLGDVRQVRITAGPGGVPEPATWAMMLIGFGAAGYSLRRRKAVALQAA
ncbi:MAG: PEPxxWA-CTERM sorting domain-containing protein [Sphingomicrobium sp.]|nr:PEPxxWA-CTERM sorting domain-containing protein [Sphingomonadales bacterium]